MSDAALEVCCGAPEHKKTYDLDAYVALLTALEGKARRLRRRPQPSPVGLRLRVLPDLINFRAAPRKV